MLQSMFFFYTTYYYTVFGLSKNKVGVGQLVGCEEGGILSICT